MDKKELLNRMSNDLDELRNIAIDEIANDILKSKMAKAFYEKNKNKYDLIVYRYGKREADLIIEDYIKDMLDEYYSKIETNVKKCNWIGEFKLLNLPYKRLSNFEIRNLYEKFEYSNIQILNPYKDHDKVLKIFSTIKDLCYLGISYDFNESFRYYFISSSNETLYEFLIDDLENGYVLDSIRIKNNDYLIEDDEELIL